MQIIFNNKKISCFGLPVDQLSIQRQQEQKKLIYKKLFNFHPLLHAHLLLLNLHPRNLRLVTPPSCSSAHAPSSPSSPSPSLSLPPSTPPPLSSREIASATTTGSAPPSSPSSSTSSSRPLPSCRGSSLPQLSLQRRGFKSSFAQLPLARRYI